MTTVREIVAAAHRKLGVLAHDENMSSDMAAVGVEAFNFMVSGWKAHGVDVSHTDQVLDDNFALAGEFREGAVFLLAQMLQPEYRFPVGFNADYFWRMLQAEYDTVQELTVPQALQRPPSREDREGNLPLTTT
jgi:predicted phage gp36 major capsid-like protein